MSYALDASTGNFPVVGVDVTMTTPAMTAELSITNIEFSEEGGHTGFKDGQGNTAARLWTDLEQGRRCRIDFFVKGTDEANAAANNTKLADLARGTSVTLSSSDFPEASNIGGTGVTWKADGITITGTQEGIVTGSLNLVPKL